MMDLNATHEAVAFDSEIAFRHCSTVLWQVLGLPFHYLESDMSARFKLLLWT